MNKNFNKNFIMRFAYPGKPFISLFSWIICLIAMWLPFNSFYYGNYFTGALILAYLSGLIFYVCKKKDFFNGGSENIYFIKVFIILLIIPLVFAINFSSSMDEETLKGRPPDLLSIEWDKNYAQNGKKYCVYKQGRRLATSSGCSSYWD